MLWECVGKKVLFGNPFELIVAVIHVVTSAARRIKLIEQHHCNHALLNSHLNFLFFIFITETCVGALF